MAALFQDEAGRQFGPYTKMSTSFDLINLKTPNLAGAVLPFSPPRGANTGGFLLAWAGRSQDCWINGAS